MGGVGIFVVAVGWFCVGLIVGLCGAACIAADRRNARVWAQGRCAYHAWFTSGEGPAGFSCRLCLKVAGTNEELVEWPLVFVG